MSLDALYVALGTNLTALGATATLAWGEKQIAQQMNQGPGRANRVLLVPGDESGAYGDYTDPAKPGMRTAAGQGNTQARSLWDWQLSARIYVWAYDGSAAEDERVQWNAMIELHDVVIEAIHKFASGHYKVRAPRRMGKVVERRFGCETMFILEYAQPVVTGTLPTTGAVAATGSTVHVGPTGVETPAC